MLNNENKYQPKVFINKKDYMCKYERRVNMNCLGDKGTIKKICNDNEYSFIGYAITPWHAHSLRAAILFLEEKEGKKLKGLVIIKPHPDSGYMIHPEFFQGFNVDCFFYQNDESIQDLLLEEIKGVLYFLKLRENTQLPFYYMKPSGFRYSKMSMLADAVHNKKIVAVSLDEGIGIHIYSLTEWYKASFKEKNRINKKLILLAKYIEMILLREEKLTQTNHYINCELIVQNRNNECDINPQMPEYYKKSFEMEQVEQSATRQYPQNDYVLINTQPITEATYCSDANAVLNILQNCINLFSKSGYQVVLKPHPRENQSIYKSMNCLVLHSGLSQESLLAHLKKKPSYIISFFSTTLISSNVIFGIKAVSLNNILLKTGVLYKSGIDTCIAFNNTFHNRVFFPQDYEELRTFLSRQ